LPLEQRENVYVINSQHISAGQSLAVLEALDLIQEQRKIKEVIKRLEAAIPNIHFLGILERSQWWKDKPDSRTWFKKEKSQQKELKKEYLLIEAKNGQIIPKEKIKSKEF